MKFLTLFLVSLFFASSFQYSTDYYTELRIRDQRALDLTGALVGVVDQLIQTVSGALNNLLTTVGNLVLNGITSIETAIQQAIANFVFDLLKAKDEIEELIGVGIVGCFSETDGKFQDIKTETIEEITECYYEGKDILTSISNDVENFGYANQQIISNVRATIEDCLKKPSFGDKITCAVEAAAITRNSVEALLQNIDNTAKSITSKIEDSIKGSYECIDNQIKAGEEQISDMLEEVRECIALKSTTIATTPDQTTTPEVATTTDPEQTTTTTEVATTTDREQTTPTTEVATTTDPEQTTTTTEVATTTDPEQTTTTTEVATTTDPEQTTTTTEVATTTDPEQTTTTTEVATTTDPEQTTTTTDFE
ncbi:hypothetical protein ACKWTF_011015 [Chironomus riparius]